MSDATLDPSVEERPLRFVLFGGSVVSDWHNPAATTTRAVLRALVAAGHEALFLEERGNRPTVELLRARGAAGVRAFAARYPTLAYRTYEIPHGAERAVWPGREIATADAVIVQDTAPVAVIEAVAALATPRLVRFLQVTQGTPPPVAERFDRLLVPRNGPVGSEGGATPFGPAVDETIPLREVGAGGVVVVAYDDTPTAARIADALVDERPVLVAPGDVADQRFRYVPEVGLGAVLRAAPAAVVAAGDNAPLAAARYLLPPSYGCAALAVATEPMPPVPDGSGVVVVELDDVAVVVRAGGQARAMQPVPVPRRYSGAAHAERLVSIVGSVLRERRGSDRSGRT